MAAVTGNSGSGEPKSVENGTISIVNNMNGLEISSEDSFAEDWGFDLVDLYKLAVKFHKEKEGKAMHLSYHDRMQLVALSQQVALGKFDDNLSPAVGYLDVIGRDRRQAWMNLGEMTREKAMAEYVQLLDRVCVLFKAYVEAHKRDIEEKERRRQEEVQRLREEEEERERLLKEEEQARLLEEQARLHEEQERQRMESQKRHIQEALNQQTYFQFKAYAEQQCSGNPDQQELLIRQLQEQHYQQYMQQVYQQQLQQQNSVSFTNREVNGEKITMNATNNNPPTETRESESSDDENSMETPTVSPASMWTRKDIREFKESIRKEGGDSIIKVGHGETVTVRVPTHEDGTCLFWEFATDSYDIGFGVYFEWTQTPGTQVSVHISESEDDDEDEDEGKESPDKHRIKVVFPNPTSRDDVEKGALHASSDRAPVTVIIPIYRRDCHEEVYAGSHVYPGQGVYLLKFDNSYSLWRSKTLYYRVYYTH